MSIFEIQILSDGRWKAKDVFEDYVAARESADRIERTRRPEYLRIRRIYMTGSGQIRERTAYTGGMKIRRERAAERKLGPHDAYLHRVADRRTHQSTAGEAAARKTALFSSNSPVYLTLVSLTIFLTGLSALYLVERAFTAY